MTDQERDYERRRYAFRVVHCRNPKCEWPLSIELQELAFETQREQLCDKCQAKERNRDKLLDQYRCCRDPRVRVVDNPSNAYLIITFCPIHGEKRHGSSE